jgi:tripartite-type tricarboxylate transporter receptor subunit TctC
MRKPTSRARPTRRTLLSGGIAIGVTLLASGAGAQDYPSHNVRVLVGFTAGSGPDVIARAVSAQLASDLKQQFYIQNVVGANGTLAIKALLAAPADGYNILYSSSSISPIPYFYKNAGFDVLKDLAPIATSGVLDGNFLLVNPSLPVHSVTELIAYAKTHRVFYGSPGVGNGLHLSTELFNVKAGIKMEHVPFRGASDVTTALLAGTIQVMFVTPPSVLSLVQAGTVRAIGFTGSKRFPGAPDVPLVKDQLPSYPVIGSWGMFYAPVNTPPAIIDKLNHAIRAALKSPAVSGVVGKSGYVPDERTPAQAAAFFKHEVEAAGEAVKAANIKTD